MTKSKTVKFQNTINEEKCPKRFVREKIKSIYEKVRIQLMSGSPVTLSTEKQQKKCLKSYEETLFPSRIL